MSVCAAYSLSFLSTKTGKTTETVHKCTVDDRVIIYTRTQCTDVVCRNIFGYKCRGINLFFAFDNLALCVSKRKHTREHGLQFQGLAKNVCNFNSLFVLKLFLKQS